LRQPSWFFPKQYYDEKEKAVIEAYKDYMFKFAKFMGSTNSDSAIKAQVNEVFNIEKSLAEVRWPVFFYA
jgi:predicted metalloendopeptidase